MGSTIHYSLKARGSNAPARKLINALYHTEWWCGTWETG
jgi:hypothetical protein